VIDGDFSTNYLNQDLHKNSKRKENFETQMYFISQRYVQSLIQKAKMKV